MRPAGKQKTYPKLPNRSKKIQEFDGGWKRFDFQEERTATASSSMSKFPSWLSRVIKI